MTIDGLIINIGRLDSNRRFIPERSIHTPSLLTRMSNAASSADAYRRLHADTLVRARLWREQTKLSGRSGALALDDMQCYRRMFASNNARLRDLHRRFCGSLKTDAHSVTAQSAAVGVGSMA